MSLLREKQRRPMVVPSDDDLDDIRNRLEALRPLGFRLTVLPVVAISVDVAVTSVTPNSEAVRTNMETAIRNFFLGLDQVGGTLPLKSIRDALNVAGLVDYTLSRPTTAIDLGERGIPVLVTLNVT